MSKHLRMMVLAAVMAMASACAATSGAARAQAPDSTGDAAAATCPPGSERPYPPCWWL